MKQALKDRGKIDGEKAVTKTCECVGCITGMVSGFTVGVVAPVLPWMVGMMQLTVMGGVAGYTAGNIMGQKINTMNKGKG